MDLVTEIYALTREFPRSEDYRLTAQITRAAVSVPSNIAEGHERTSARDYASFLSISKGSLMETETLLTIACRLGYLEPEPTAPTFSLITEISKMLTVLRRNLLRPR
jgi:four helix bundle protein